MCPRKKKHGVCLGNTYQTDKACKNFIVAITDELKYNISETVKSACFIGVMADGARDVGTREVEDVHGRFLENAVPVSRFAALKECHNAKATGIAKAIREVLNEIDDNWKQKLVCLGSDGVSVMIGKDNSVYVHLKTDVPSLISIHCVAQKLELGFQDTMKDVKLFQDAKEMLQGIWK